jgi:AmmeMemoRadiSam system protein B
MAIGDFRLVPLVMGSQEYDVIIALGEVLGATLEGRKALIVASSDLSHYHDVATAARLDQGISNAIERFDWKVLYDRVTSGQSEACGAGPMMSCMYAAKRLGATTSEIVKYTHSGMVAGGDSEVVGYLSAAFLR